MAAARFDVARFGAEVFRPSPRQADLMIVAGRLSQKMAPVYGSFTIKCRAEMGDFNGSLRNFRGVFNNYAIVQGCNQVIPWTYTYQDARRRKPCCIQSCSCRRNRQRKGSFKRALNIA